MMTRLPIAVVLAILVDTGASQAVAQPPAENALDKLSWFVGGKWVADIKTPKSDPITVETTFAWAGHKKALKYTVVFKTKDTAVPQYEGMYWWNPAKKTISLLQIDRAGNVTESLLTVDGDKLTQRNTLTRLDGTQSQQRVHIVRENDDTFSFKASILQEMEWVEAVSLKYKRAGAGAAPKPK